MSRERAVRRAEREREAALRTAARAAARERAERRAARHRFLTRWLAAGTGGRPGRPTGILAERRRARLRLLVTGLALVQVLVWVVRPDWPARLGALLVSLLLLPLLVALTA